MKVNANYTWIVCRGCGHITKILPGQKFNGPEDFTKLFECECECELTSEALSEFSAGVKEDIEKIIEPLDKIIDQTFGDASKEDLIQLAKNKGIKRAATMSKETLIKRLNDAT